MNRDNFTILVIEDEDHIAEGLILHLELHQYRVLRARDGQEGLMMWSQERPDLIILDIMMPKIDGHRVLELVRKRDEKLPILILTARDSAQDKIQALSKGVDDYLSKPFDAQELLLRIERLLVRSSWYQDENVLLPSSLDRKDTARALLDREQITIGPSIVDLATGRLSREGSEEYTLTEQELRLLRVFLAYEGIPMSRKDLLGLAWDYADSVESRTLDNFIVRLRKYFEQDPKRPLYFRSVRSVGYLFERPK